MKISKRIIVLASTIYININYKRYEYKGDNDMKCNLESEVFNKVLEESDVQVLLLYMNECNASKSNITINLTMKLENGVRLLEDFTNEELDKIRWTFGCIKTKTNLNKLLVKEVLEDKQYEKETGLKIEILNGKKFTRIYNYLEPITHPIYGGILMPANKIQLNREFFACNAGEKITLQKDKDNLIGVYSKGGKIVIEKEKYYWIKYI